MAVNPHQPPDYALFDAMPAPLLTVGGSRLLTGANRAASYSSGSAKPSGYARNLAPLTSRRKKESA